MALPGLVNVRQGDETGRLDLRLPDGEIVPPTTLETCLLDITFTRAGSFEP